MSSTTQDSPVWLITGVSAGFGNLLAARALDAGFRVIGTVRNRTKAAPKIEPLESRGMRTVELDATESRSSIVSKIRQQALTLFGGRVDVLVNNAGYAHLGAMERVSDGEVAKQMATNTLGPLWITQAVLPTMRRARSGIVVNFSSFVGFRADAANGVYAMSKFALEAWTEALSKEVDEFGITCIIAEFGAFRTGFLEQDHYARPEMPAIEGYEGSRVEKIFQNMGAYSNRQPGEPSKGVEAIFKVITAGGVVKGRKVLRVVIGGDAVDVVDDKLNSVRADWEVCREVEAEESTAIVE